MFRGDSFSLIAMDGYLLAFTLAIAKHVTYTTGLGSCGGSAPLSCS